MNHEMCEYYSGLNKHFTLIGLTKYAYDKLSVKDIEDLELMIGSEIEQAEEKDMYFMPDGETCHKDFLIIKIKDMSDYYGKSHLMNALKYANQKK